MKLCAITLLVISSLLLTGSMQYEPYEFELAKTTSDCQEYVTQKDYVDMRVGGLMRQIDQSLAAMNLRLEGMNQFRDQLNMQSKTFITKEMFDARNIQQDKDIRELRESRATLEGAASQTSMYITLTISMTALVLTLVGLFMRSRKV